MTQAIARIFKDRRWLDLIYWARRQIWLDGWRYLRRYSGAVEAVKAAFYMTYGRPAYQTMTDQCGKWDGMIAQYIRALGGKPGVAMLIDDIKVAKMYNPQSILFFLIGKNGGSSRWEKLIIDYMHREQQRMKAETEVAAKTFPAEMIGKEITPDWVKGCCERWEDLSKQGHRFYPVETSRRLIMREMAAIESRLHNAGYNTKGKKIK